jgi:hypothetical protein
MHAANMAGRGAVAAARTVLWKQQSVVKCRKMLNPHVGASNAGRVSGFVEALATDFYFSMADGV